MIILCHGLLKMGAITEFAWFGVGFGAEGLRILMVDVIAQEMNRIIAEEELRPAGMTRFEAEFHVPIPRSDAAVR